MKTSIIHGVLAAIFLWATAALGAEIPDKTRRGADNSLQKTASLGLYQILNINNLWTWHRADGQSNHSPTGMDGTFFPRGTRWVIYQDAMVWGGKVYRNAARTDPAPVQLIRVGGATYNIGTRAGWIEGSGETARAVSPADPRVRVYRIRRDYAHMTFSELQKDAAESFEIPTAAVTDAHIQQIKDNYARDWDEWPVAQGAPYIERNGIPGYQKPPAFNLDPLLGPVFTVDDLIKGRYDEPGVAGADPDSPADQVLYMVFNDLDRVATLGFVGSEPIGLEIQKTVWGYKRTDAMGNLYFQRVKIINKGGVDIGGGRRGSFWVDSMFVAQWSDPDLGAFGDDLAGCDTLLSMGFVYNGRPVDAEFAKFGLPPPAVGYDFLQGPIVRGAPTDSAVFDFKRRRGFRNLPMTSFAYFSAGAPISDPPFNYEGALRWWKMLRGFEPNESTGPDRFYPHPPGVTPTPYPLSGDPVRGTGFIDGLGTPFSFAPGDRRIVLNSGPFVLAPGDTQEVVVGVVAGLGGDRLSSISVMKANDKAVQETYDLLFLVARPPAPPKVKVAELDGEVILEWGSDPAAVRSTETPIAMPGEYHFEGYNVYQFPLKDSPLKDAKLIATYDLTTDPRVVFDEVFDLRSAQFIRVPVQFGSNSGIKRYFHFKRDYIRDIDKLYNGQEYYLAVTAYSVARLPGYTAALESSPIVLTVRPQSPKPGHRIFEKANTQIPNRVVAGKTDVKEIPILMIDPTQAKTSTYRITFFDSLGVPWWRLRDHPAGRELFRSRNLGFQVTGRPDDDYEFPIINGFQPRVLGEPYVVRADSTRWIPARPPEIADGTRFTASPGIQAHGVTPAWDIYHPGTGVVRYLAVFESSWSILSGVPIEIRFGPAHTSKAYRTRRVGPPPRADYVVLGFADVPFSVWDVSVSPARQLTVAWRDQDNNGRWNPPEGGDGIEVFWVYNKTYDPLGRQFTYPDNPDPARRGPGVPGEPTIGATADIMYVVSLFGGPGGVSGLPGSVSTATLRVVPTYPLNSTVVIEFSTKGPEYSVELAKADAVEKIGVFPNPYYAFNAAETNRFIRFVTFNFLPQRATIRIFNLAGHLVRTIEKDDPSQFLRWDLTNQFNFPVASGIYIAHIDMPDLGVSKVLKLAIIQEQEILETY